MPRFCSSSFHVFYRRGLTKLPMLVGETRVRLLSLQHNLITRLDGMPTQGLTKLVFLDIYDNQLERITGLDSLVNLRVLLVGKNR
jgi:leucine-rich repeat-containing protein 49